MREETGTRRSHEAEIEVKIRGWSLKKSHGRVTETGGDSFLLLQTKTKKVYGPVLSDPPVPSAGLGPKYLFFFV